MKVDEAIWKLFEIVRLQSTLREGATPSTYISDQLQAQRGGAIVRSEVALVLASLKAGSDGGVWNTSFKAISSYRRYLSDGSSLLTAAVCLGQVDLVTELVGRGFAAVTAPDCRGKCALDYARERSAQELVDILENLGREWPRA